MSALTAFSDVLQDRINGTATGPINSSLLEAFSMCLSLALETGGNSETPGPTTRKIPVKAQLDAFTPIIFVNQDTQLLYQTESDMACIRLSDGVAVPAPANAAAFFKNGNESPDGLYQTDRSDFVRVFEKGSKEEAMQLSWPRSSREACTVNVVFSPDNRLIAVTYAYDSAIRLWDFQSKSYLGEMPAADHEAALAFSPDSRFLFAGTKSGVDLFHVESGLSIWHHRAKQCYSVGYSSDGLLCAYDENDPHIVTVNLQALGTPISGGMDQILDVILEHWNVWEGQMQWEAVYYQAGLL